MFKQSPLILSLRKPLFAVLSKSITISRGDGIPPNLARNLDILRRVGTLSVVKQVNRKAKSLRTRRRKL